MRWTGRLLKSEKGYGALTLALIGLMFTGMLVIPFLLTVQSSLLAIRRSGQAQRGLSCVGAGAEHALWRLQYDQAFRDSPEDYIFPCDDLTIDVGVALLPGPSPLPDYLLQYAYADIVLVADVSASISSSEMSVFKQAAHAVVDAFNLDENPDRYAMGLTRFGGVSYPVVSMSNTSAPLHNGINTLHSTSILVCLFYPNTPECKTNMVAAIQGGTAQFSTGLGDRPDIPNLMVIFTDGDDTSGNSIAAIEDASAASGATIFAVGVDAVFLSTLNAIASEPDEDHVFYVSDFDDLLSIINDIVAAVNREAAVGTLYDIQVTGPNGATIRVRALVDMDGTVQVVSWQEY